MARVKGMQKIVGSFANVSFYTIQGSDEVYVRSKGGPSKRAIKTKPQFEKLRRNNSEWSGCTKFASSIRMGYYFMQCLEDYPTIGALNALAKEIQLADTENEHGKRCLYLTKNKEKLLGFPLSKKQVFESVLRVPVDTTLNRDTMQATIHIPAINTASNLYNFRKLPYFRLCFELGGISDMIIPEGSKRYERATEEVFYKGESYKTTDWMSTTGTIEAMDILLKYNQEEPPVNEVVTLILTIGLEFGTVNANGQPEGVKYSGVGKIVRVA